MARMSMKVLTIGGAMIDTIAIVDSGRIERMSMSNAHSSFLLLEEGRKTEAEEVSMHVGGGAVNVAVAMARLGLDVAVLAKLGADARAETILQRLEQEGVSTAWVKRDPRSPTGASVFISSHDRNAAIFTFRGANTLLEAADLQDEAFAVGVVYIANLSNESADCFPVIVERAKKHGALIAANPGPRQLSARGRAFFENLAALVAWWLKLNRRRIARFQLAPVRGVQCDEDEASQRHAKADRHAPIIRHPAHNQRHESATDDRHDDEGGGNFCFLAQSMNAQ